MILIDPDTDKIRNICESLIGSEIKLNFTITLKSGETCSGDIDNCNIIGDCMENVIFPFIKKQIPSFKEGPKQSSPDFYNFPFFFFFLYLLFYALLFSLLVSSRLVSSRLVWSGLVWSGLV